VISLLIACSGTPTQDPGVATPVEPRGPLDVRATDWPSHWLATRIGGEHAEVTCILPEGEDAAFWQPPGDLVASLDEADLVVTNGADFAAWMKTAALPGMKVLETADSVDLIVKKGETHSHGNEGAHSHNDVNPHTWTDPKIFAEQAGTVRVGLTMLDADHADAYAANTEAVLADLDALHAELEAATADLGETELVLGHDFAYLARRYALKTTHVGHGIEVELSSAEGPEDYLAEMRKNVAALDAVVE